LVLPADDPRWPPSRSSPQASQYSSSKSRRPRSGRLALRYAAFDRQVADPDACVSQIHRAEQPFDIPDEPVKAK
jgi:hypothetical protein